MLNTALNTIPVSYSEVWDTFGAADCAAARTHLGGESLVSLDVFGPVPYGFVAELGSKLRPAGIEDGLRHAGAGESCCVHVADDDASVLAHESGRELVREVLAAVDDFGVDCLRSLPLAR